MSRVRIVARFVWVLVVAFSLSASAAGAQQTRHFSFGVLTGIGSALDADDADANNFSLQVNLAFLTELKTQIGVRLGTIEFDSSDRLDSLMGGDLTYLTIAGEYRFSESFFESGLFLGVGIYELDGVTPAGVAESQSAIGLTAGVSGEFPVNPRWSVLVELVAHRAEFDAAKLFGSAAVGFLYHF